MRTPRVRFTVCQVMATVATMALVSLAVTNTPGRGGTTDTRVVTPVASLVAAAYGLGSMRRPWMFLWPLIVVWVAAPRVDHPAPDVVNVGTAGCFLGWVIGAPAGWVARRVQAGGRLRAVLRERRPS